MITSVALNPALDKIYFVDNFEPGKMYRVREMVKSAGGKGVNVARVSRMMGESIRLIGFKGGEAGNWLELQLKKLGVCTGFVEVCGETRTNNNIIDRERDNETEVLELGPFISGEDMERFMTVYKEALADSKVVVLSGGLPQGVPANYYETLIEAAKPFGVPVILDTGGEALSEGIKAKPHVIKPNLRELSNLVQKELKDMGEILEVLRRINADGVDIAMVSMGEQGAILSTKDSCIRVKVPSVAVVNTIGSGDAMVAGFATGLARSETLEECLRLAAACGMSNARFLEIGVVDKNEVETQKGRVEIERIF
ncbi:1-phosphofructokinase family hexose kinase [Acetivibrio mesophilus]|uniref:Tagatose-6-phosphate kinase n=1 Tax=Acetivibrio mesophilus TaxID=2487273 RepID=A0A4V1K233_9FIRM|nr:1-phosphofructokinase family hexose kinase [Acetivibrio mesophilus]RXE58889.1 1-phosphofructokinase family hexose kinase [Acetivibrio mesophilus]